MKPTNESMDAARYRCVRDMDRDEFGTVIRRAISRHWGSESFEDAFDRIVDGIIEEKKQQMERSNEHE